MSLSELAKFAAQGKAAIVLSPVLFVVKTKADSPAPLTAETK
jgi:hypothetical protein